MYRQFVHMAELKVLTWVVNGKVDRKLEAAFINCGKSTSFQQLIQPNQTFLDVIKQKLPQHTEAIEQGKKLQRERWGYLNNALGAVALSDESDIEEVD